MSDASVLDVYLGSGKSVGTGKARVSVRVRARHSGRAQRVLRGARRRSVKKIRKVRKGVVD